MVTRYLLAACLIAVAMAEEVDNNQALLAIVPSTNAFSSQLFQTVVEENPGNLIMSPLSAAIVLGMVAYGARGETENQFRKVLHLPSPDSLGKSGYQALIDNANNTKENTLILANKVFMTETYSVKPSYRELTETYFRSTTQLVDFAKSDEAANIINTWVERITNNHINGIVSPRDLDGLTALVLVNAVYFKGQWKNKFNAKRTMNIPFHVNENTVQNVPTMNREGRYVHGELSNLNAQFIEIPYQGDELSMVIILPNEINGLPMVEKKLQGMSMADILKQGYEGPVKLFLPKFKIEKMMDLEPVLKKMGLTDMFTDRANFSGIADGLSVSKVVQKAFIEVNEEGSTAAAVTMVEGIGRSLSTYPFFSINRPFWYAITTRNASIILFNGRIVNPAQSSVGDPHASE